MFGSSSDKHDKRRVETQLQMLKKRGKSPLSKEPTKDDRTKSSPEKCVSVNSDSDYRSTKLSLQWNCKFFVKLGKFGVVRCTPEGKRTQTSNKNLGQSSIVATIQVFNTSAE